MRLQLIRPEQVWGRPSGSGQALLGSCFAGSSCFGPLLILLLTLSPPGVAFGQDAQAEQALEGSRPAALGAAAAKASGDSEPSDRAPLGTSTTTKLGVYSDNDQVQVVTPLVSVSQRIYDTTQLGVSWDADVLTAASIDVRTAASKGFKEMRNGVALTVDHSFLAQELTASAAVSGSREADYASLTVGGGLSKELFQKNLTLAGGYAYVGNLVGRSLTRYSQFHERLDIHALNASATQLLSRTTLLQLSTSFITARGYQASVYRYVPVFLSGRAGTELKLDEQSLLDGSAAPLYRVAETLPETRLRWAGVIRINHYLPWKMALAADYRLYLDSWALASHTFAIKLHQELPFGIRLRLRGRFYTQRAASFYQEVYRVDRVGDRPAWLTMDRELSTYWYGLVGAKLVFALPAFGPLRGSSIDLKVDYQRTRYANFAYLQTRDAWVFEAGFTMEL